MRSAKTPLTDAVDGAEEVVEVDAGVGEVRPRADLNTALQARRRAHADLGSAHLRRSLDSALEVTTLDTEASGFQDANCLDRAAHMARPTQDDLVFLDDLRSAADGNANGAGHVLVRDRDSGVVRDPNLPSQTFESVEDWMAKTGVGEGAYRERASIPAKDVQTLLRLPPEDRRDAAAGINPDLEKVIDQRYADPAVIQEFFAPIENNPHVDRLVQAGLLPENPTVAEFYNLKFSLGATSFGAGGPLPGEQGITFDDISVAMRTAEAHGMNVVELGNALDLGSRQLGDRSSAVFRSFLEDPGWIGGKFDEHEANLRRMMVFNGIEPEYTDKMFDEMIGISGYGDQPLNGFPNEYEYGKWVLGWTSALDVVGANSAGGVADELASLRRLWRPRSGTVAADNGMTAAKIIRVGGDDVVDAAVMRAAGKAIADDDVATAAYRQLQDNGTTVIFNFDDLPRDEAGRAIAGVADGLRNTVTVYMRAHRNKNDVVSTLVHESSHMRRFMRGHKPSQLDEYYAFRREFIFNNGRRPTPRERAALWERVRRDYPDLPPH